MLSKLSDLRLEANGFTGTIPSQFGALRRLQVLSLGKGHHKSQAPRFSFSLNLPVHLQNKTFSLAGLPPRSQAYHWFRCPSRQIGSLAPFRLSLAG
jgi:hypothetical protein